MSDLQFTLQDCDDVVKQCLQVEDARTTDFEIIPRQENNFIFKITINKPSHRTLYFYAKSKSKAPRNAKIFDDFKMALPDFNTNIAPKFVCGKSELLFFEDLTCEKFQTNPSLFDLKHMQLVLEMLAEFHAAGLAFSKNGGEIDKYHLEESNFDLDEVGDLVWSLVDNKESVNEVRRNLEERRRSKFAKTLCHGNLRWENILYHYENGVPDECRLVNFGGKLYAPPVYDVLQVIFFNTNENFRKCNLDSLLFHYYSRLKEGLQKYLLRAEDVLPREEFQESYFCVLPLVKVETVITMKKMGDEDELKSAKQEMKEALSFSRFTREDCYIVVKNAIQSTGYVLLSFDLTSLDDHRLKICIRQDLEDKTIDCFVKIQSKEKDAFVYTVLVPKLQQLNILLVNDCLPQCYCQKLDDLVLEFLQSYCKTESLESSVASLVVKNLAKFHACSLLAEEEMSKKMKTTYRLTKDYNNLLQDCAIVSKISRIRSRVDLFPNKSRQESLQQFLSGIAEDFRKPSDRFRNVVSMGVFSKKNILLRYEDNTPVDCRFVDFETATYRPPALDFLSLVYLTGNEEELMKMYYDELEKTVTLYNHNVRKILSYQEFEDSVEYYRPHAIVQSIIYSVTEENFSLIDDPEEFLARLCESPVFRQKWRQNVADLYQVCRMLPNVEV